MRRNKPVLFIMMFLASLLIGCDSSQLSRENFSHIEHGMSEQKVYDILGEPADTSSLQLGGLAGTSAVWKDDRTRITIQFINDKVQIKQFTRSEDDPVVD